MAALAFREEAIGAIDGLQIEADIRPTDVDGLHYHVLTRFPYTVHHELDERAVTVLAIAHHKRRPGYWARWV
jgi:hypothetical protein